MPTVTSPWRGVAIRARAPGRRPLPFQLGVDAGQGPLEIALGHHRFRSDRALLQGLKGAFKALRRSPKPCPGGVLTAHDSRSGVRQLGTSLSRMASRVRTRSLS